MMGFMGDRYRIVIRNPTSRRVEAVISVDGLDAIDGKTASYEDKRGYVIAPYGELTIDVDGAGTVVRRYRPASSVRTERLPAPRPVKIHSARGQSGLEAVTVAFAPAHTP